MLHGACKDVCNWSWDCIECTIAEDAAEIACKIAELAPDMVGASLYIFNRNAVLDILGSYAQFGIGLLITEQTLNATAFFSVEIVIPPDMLRVIGGLQEYRVALLIES